MSRLVGSGSRSYALSNCAGHESGHAVLATAHGIPISSFRLELIEEAPGVFGGGGNVRLARVEPGEVGCRIALGGYVAEVIDEREGLDFERFCAVEPRNGRLQDIENARAHAWYELTRHGLAAEPADVTAYVGAAWRSVTAYLSRPETWSAVERVRRFAIERYERGGADVLTPAETAFLDAIGRSLPPPNSERAQDNRAHIVPIHDTIGEEMSPTEIASAARGLDRRIHRSHAPVIATALRKAGHRGPAAVDDLVGCLNAIASRGGFDHERVEAAPSSHVELTARRSTSPARRSAPSSDSRVDAKFAALAGVDVAEFKRHREELNAVDAEEREAAHDDASQSDARRAERLCAQAAGLDLGAFRAACEHVGGLEPHQGGAVGFTLEQLGGVPSNGKKGNPASDDADSGDEGSGNADDDDGDEDEGDEAEKKALHVARKLGWSGSGKAFLAAWRADRAAARNG